MAGIGRKTRIDKGISRSSTLSGLITTFMEQTDQARHVLLGVLAGLDQQLRDGSLTVRRRGDEVDDQEDPTADEISAMKAVGEVQS